MRREGGAPAALTAFGEGGFGEERDVVAGWVVRGEVGGDEKVGGVVGEGVGGWFCRWMSVSGWGLSGVEMGKGGTNAFLA